MIYNPYNTTMQNPGLVQPTMLPQTDYSAVQPTTYQPMQQMVMPSANYQPIPTQVVNQPTYQPVQQMAMPAYPAPTCGVPTPQPMIAPQPMVQPAQHPVQQQMKATQPHVMSTEATTAQHKKTTYVEAYLEPVDAQVPLMQPLVTKKSTEKQSYPVSDEIVYVDQEPVKSSTLQDYNLYLMENEYYTANPSITYQKTTSPQARADQNHLTCSNIPLATTYIRMQTYGGINTPTQTLQQGTAFNELYSPYTPKTTSTPMVYMLKGGQQ